MDDQGSQLIAWDAASTLISEVVSKAAEVGIRVCVAIVDTSGVSIVSFRMPGAFLHSLDIASDKAFTAASFGVATRDLADILEAQPARVKSGLLARPRFVAIGGGVVLVRNGTILGALGVSGGTEDEDMICVQSAIARFWM